MLLINTLSMKVCQNWFEETARMEAAHIDGEVSRVLIFNILKTKDPYSLLKRLMVRINLFRYFKYGTKILENSKMICSIVSALSSVKKKIESSI